jgi:hemoglobin
MNSALARAPVMYEQIGGEEPLRRLVDHFYDIVETHPDGEPVHRLHLQGFGVAHLRQAQFDFLSGFLGGPRYYVERMGHSNVRQMHAHLAIGPAEVRSWLRCMAHAVEKAGIPADVGSRLMQHFTRVAEALRNRD